MFDSLHNFGQLLVVCAFLSGNLLLSVRIEIGLLAVKGFLHGCRDERVDLLVVKFDLFTEITFVD